MRANEQTLRRLFRHFEDLVTENGLAPLVIEGRCADGAGERERERLGKLARAARHVYLFACDRSCPNHTWDPDEAPNLTVVADPTFHEFEGGPFLLIMDQRFCGLLASFAVEGGAATPARIYEIIWTYDPNVVFTAIEYLMARITAQIPAARSRFAAHLNASTPRNVSLRLALTLMTKLTELMQRQSELEMATHRIGSTISGTLELESVLQLAVEEVGRALKARRVALVLWQEGSSLPENMSVYERPEVERTKAPATARRRKGDTALLSAPSGTGAHDASPAEQLRVIPGPLELPITYRNSVIGVLAIEDDTPGRVWEDEEVLMARTVADQLAVAVSHARLFRQMQTQAITDALTGLYNHRHMQDRLDRELAFADRHHTEVSLILLDLDHLKRINDTLGHRAGDAALQHVSRVMQATVRAMDICARYGGEEFVIILPQCGQDDACKVAERLRAAIAEIPVERVGHVTASVGVASYPTGGRSKEELIEMADRAMYLAKAAGRNRVRTLLHRNAAEKRA